jgi:hypothetical protein
MEKSSSSMHSFAPIPGLKRPPKRKRKKEKKKELVALLYPDTHFLRPPLKKIKIKRSLFVTQFVRLHATKD